MEDKERYKAGERAIAPLFATVIPALIITVLMVVTAVSSRPRLRLPPIDIPRPDETDIDRPDPDQPDPDPIQTDEPDVVPDIQIDTPMPQSVDKLAPPQPQSFAAEPTVVAKLAPENAVLKVKSPVNLPSLFGVRGGPNRAKYTSDGIGGKYGSAETEVAVMKALRWLKKTQRTDGSWAGNPISNTGLAILSYLAHGEVPARSKEFGPTVQLALEYLIGAQSGEGDEVRFRGADGNEYAFLIATYALSEAYGMTHNPNAKEAALKGLGRIVRNQSPTGGWDYRLNRTSTRDDMSFAGWALQALKAGKIAGLHPEGLDECIRKAIRCLETRNFRSGGFGYTAGGAPTGLTATGCLAMQLLGFGERAAVKSALDYMREWRPSFDPAGMAAKAQGACPQYYCYYAAQCKYQAGMKQGATPADTASWQAWNQAMKALYPKTIVTPDETIEGMDGKPRQIGYWTNKDAHGSGDTMATCLCALQLMVYYRYLPTTQAERRTEPVKSRSRPIRRDVCVDVDV